MAKEQKAWSKNSSLSGPFKDRQFQRLKPLYSDNRKYGHILDIKGEDQYDSNFKRGLLAKIDFDNKELNDNFSNTWFIFDIDHDSFIERFGSLSSAKEYLIGSRACVVYKSTDLSKGKLTLIADLSKIYDSGYQSTSLDIGSLVSGFSEGSTSKFRILKHSYNKNSNTGIKLSDKSIEIIGDEKNFINLSEKGISISGNVNFQTNPSNITFGGIFAMPDFIRGMIPSTVTTPNPMYLPTLPTNLLLSLGDLASMASGWLS